MERVNRVSAHINAGGSSPSAAATAAGGHEGDPVVVTLIASGNSGHVCAALFEGNTHGRVRTQVLTSQPHIWKNKRPRVRFPDGSVQVGYVHRVSDDPAELIPQSDIVLWTGPVNATKEMFENIRFHLDPRRTAVGTIFAQGLVHLLVHRMFGPHVRFFALRNIPWLCKVVKVGEESQIVGTKTSIGVTTINLDEQWVKSLLEPLFFVQRDGKKEPVLEMLPDFCPIVFNPANQIIHPARYWAMFRNWKGQPLTGSEEPSEWLYRGMDEVAGQILTVLDEELQLLKNAYFAATGAAGCTSVVSLRERLLEHYGDQIEDRSTLAKMVGTNKAYHMAKTPVIRTELGVMPDPNHRVVTDDIGWGLCALLSVAERLEVAGAPTPTTMMRAMIEWHQRMMGKEYVYNGRLVGRDCADLVLLKRGDSLDLVARPPPSPARDWLTTVEMVADENRIGNP